MMLEYLETTIDKFVFRVAKDRFYSSNGVWAQAEGNKVRIGLSDFLQQRSGDIAFVDVTPAGSVLQVGQDVAVIETIKVNIELQSPVSGTILLVNPSMETAPEIINQDPYGEGWLCEIEAVDWAADQEKLLDPASYFSKMKQEGESEVNNQ